MASGVSEHFGEIGHFRESHPIAIAPLGEKVPIGRDATWIPLVLEWGIYLKQNDRQFSTIKGIGDAIARIGQPLALLHLRQGFKGKGPRLGDGVVVLHQAEQDAMFGRLWLRKGDRCRVVEEFSSGAGRRTVVLDEGGSRRRGTARPACPVDGSEVGVRVCASEDIAARTNDDLSGACKDGRCR